MKNKRLQIGLKETVVLNLLFLSDLVALVYEIGRGYHYPKLQDIPFEEVRDYLNKIKKGKHTSTFYRLQKENVISVGPDEIQVDFKTNWWQEFLNLKFRFFTAQEKWDKQWTIVSFDVPESKKKLRDQFRRILRKMGFVPWQRSVWVTITPVRSLLGQMIKKWELENCVLVFSAQSLFQKDEKTIARRLFNLKKLEKKYQNFNLRAERAIQQKNQKTAQELIYEFPSLISEDTGIPNDLFRERKIKKRLCRNIQKLQKINFF